MSPLFNVSNLNDPPPANPVAQRLCQAALDGNLDLIKRLVQEYGNEILAQAAGYVNSPCPVSGEPVHPQDKHDRIIQKWKEEHGKGDSSSPEGSGISKNKPLEQFGLWTPGFDTYCLRPVFNPDKQEGLKDPFNYARKPASMMQYAVFAGQVDKVEVVKYMVGEGAPIFGKGFYETGEQGAYELDELFGWNCDSLGTCRWWCAEGNDGVKTDRRKIWEGLKECGGWAER